MEGTPVICQRSGKWSNVGLFKTSLLIFGSLLVGLFLVSLLALLPGFDFASTLQNLYSINLLFFFLLVLSNVFHFWITGVKWRLVLEAVTPDVKFGSGYFIYSSLNALIGQFLPLQFSTVTVRTLAMRFHIRIPMLKGALSTVYDLMFDLTVAALALIASLTVLLGIFQPLEAFVFLAIELVIAGSLISMFNMRVALCLVRLRRHIPFLDKALAKGAAGDDSSEGPGLAVFSPALTAKLFTLSIIRYVNLVFRNFLIIPTVGLSIGIIPVALTLPFVLFASVISITPANLGICEWTWVGIFTVLNVPTLEAANYSVLRKLLLLFVIILIAVGIFVSLLFGLVLRRKAASHQQSIEEGKS